MTPSRSPRGMTRLQLAVSVMGFVTLNVVGAVIYKLSRPRPEAPVAAPAPSPLDLNAEKFRVYRSAGLMALEKGDYDKAVEQFMQALRVGRADSDIMELIKMAKEFQARGPAKVAAAEPEPEPEPEVVAVAVPSPVGPAPTPKKKEPARPARPAPARKEPVRVAEVRPRTEEPPPLLTLLVTSIPSGLIIEVDGARKDMTPAKVQVPAGTHAVSFFKGENRLLQRTVTGEGGQVLTVDADLSTKLAPSPSPSPSPSPEPVAVAKVEPPAPPAPAVPAPAPARLTPPPALPPSSVTPSVTPPAPVAAMVAPTGELQIISLNVHGEVFVDGQSYGYTPVVAKNLPAQQVKIEVKVDGSVRRSRTADVVAGKRSTIKIP